MIIRKLGGSLAVAILAFSTNAIAGDCTAQADDIKNQFVKELLCTTDGGWWYDTPIWQYQGKKGDGCVVHGKLAKQLYVAHDDNDPPTNKGGKNGFREAKGVANSLYDRKFEEALQSLQIFIDTIENDAKPNPAFPGGVPAAENEAGLWVLWAKGMQDQIDPVNGCN